MKSPNMEKLGWERAIKTITDNDIVISEMVTDAHVQITASMSEYLKFLNVLKFPLDVFYCPFFVGRK